MMASHAPCVGSVRLSLPVRCRPSHPPEGPRRLSALRPPSSFSIFFHASLLPEVAPHRKYRASRSHFQATCRNGWTWIPSTLRNALVILAFTYSLAVVRLLFSVIPPDFARRWDALVGEEAACAEVRAIPSHVWQAVVATEDRRFFRHGGVDPRGIARAVFSLTANGGGSTITQQLVKNVLLKNNRRWARKVVEGLLALCLEKKMSKWQILWAYLRKIYWGHGVYGINSASTFYFGKPPSSLSLGESALLAGIIPSPESLSPFKDPSRGKKSQARALRKMVEAGYLDIDKALQVLNQPICLYNDEAKQEKVESLKTVSVHPIWKDVWDWERESSILEVRELMETWTRKHRQHMNRICTMGNVLEYLFKLVKPLSQVKRALK